jgi:hypothetical protein
MSLCLRRAQDVPQLARCVAVARALVGFELMDKGLETIMAGEIVPLAGTVHSSTILVNSGMGPATQLRQHGISVIVVASPKSGASPRAAVAHARQAGCRTAVP